MFKMSRVDKVLFFLCFLKSINHIEGDSVRNFPRRFSLQNALLSYLCQSSNGVVCNGQGQCSGGDCYCNDRYTGPYCETLISSDTVAGQRSPRFDADSEQLHNTGNDVSGVTDNGPEIMACFGNNEGVCNGHGVCVNGTCLCEPDWAGITCELQKQSGFCETYKSCAECTALLTPCPSSCDVSTKFQLVTDFPISGGTFYRCRYRNVENDCTYFYQLASTSRAGVKTIMVKTCSKYQISTPSTGAEEMGVTAQEVTTAQEEVTSRSTSSQPPLPNVTISKEEDDRDFCEKYRECAECTALMTACPTKCANMANFELVFGFPSNSGSFYRCRYRNVERDCSFYFQLDETRSDGPNAKTIMVKTCLKYRTKTSSAATPKQTLVSSASPAEVVTSRDDDGSDDKNEENMSDRNRGMKDDDNGTNTLTVFGSVNIVVVFNVIRFLRISLDF